MIEERFQCARSMSEEFYRGIFDSELTQARGLWFFVAEEVRSIGVGWSASGAPKRSFPREEPRFAGSLAHAGAFFESILAIRRITDISLHAAEVYSMQLEREDRQ